MGSLVSFLLIKASDEFLGLSVGLALSNRVECFLQCLVRPVLTGLREPGCRGV